MSRWRQILQSATEFAVIVTDRDGTITEWNTGAERILGWSADEMIGEDAARIFTPEDRAAGQIDREMEASLREGRGVDERWHMKADGTRFWASGEMMPLREEDGSHSGFVKILRDRTDQHLAGMRLEEVQTQLAQAQTAGGIGVFTVDVASGTIEATPEFSRLYGLDHVERRPATEVEATVVPEDRALISTDASRRAGTTEDDVVYRIRRPDTGEVRWLSRKAELRFDTTGRPVRFSGVARDVTAQKAAEALLAAGETRWKALSDISETLLGIADPDAMVAAVAAIVGRTLNVGRVGYGTVAADGETFTVPADWTREGYPSLAGTYRMDDYGGYAEDLRQGRDVVIADIRLAPRTSADTAPLEGVGVRTLVNHPVVENGRTVAILYVNDAEPRDWTADEITFLRDASLRTRTAIERLRAEAALRESDDRFRTFVENVDVGICILEVEFDADGRAVDYLYLDANPAMETQAGVRDVVGRRVSEIVPDIEQYWKDLYGGVAVTGVAQHVTYEAKPLGRLFDIRALKVGDPQGRRIAVLFTDVTERVAAEERRTVLNRELAHRLKNTLAIVQSIATQTLRVSPDMTTARKTLTERIGVLSKAHDILLSGQRDAASIRAIVEAATKLHDEGGRVRPAGPDVPMGPRASLTLSLILHELSTNAGKYGALSVEGGHVEVAWSVDPDAETRQPRLSFEWREVGGPPVTPPARKSFGTRLIEMGLSGAAAGSSELDYAPDGLVCRITASLTELQASDESERRS